MIRAGSLRGFQPLVEELGGDPGPLLRRFGIATTTLASDDGLVPITAHDLMLDAAAEALGCPDFGLRLAERQDLSILGPLAIAVESSATVAEALDCAARFLFVHSPALQIKVEPDPRGVRGVVAASYRKDLRESPYSPQAMELGLGLFHHVAVLLLGGVTGLRSVEIPHPPLSPVQRYLDFFEADVKFGAPFGGLRVERSILDRGFDSADATIRQLAVEHLAAHYPDPAAGIAPRVRAALAELLATGTPTLARVARLLALHPRTLQRRLARDGTSFESLLDDVRRSTALRYITTSDLPFTQIATLTGFTEQSTLCHAAVRWYDVSPRELRRRSR